MWPVATFRNLVTRFYKLVSAVVRGNLKDSKKPELLCLRLLVRGIAGYHLFACARDVMKYTDDPEFDTDELFAKCEELKARFSSPGTLSGRVLFPHAMKKSGA